MGFAQSDSLTGCYRFALQPSNVNTTSFGLCHWKKKSSSLITVVGEQVAFLQCTTTIGQTSWYAASKCWEAIHGPVGHLSATDNSFWRRIFTDLWLPLRGNAARTHTAVQNKQKHAQSPCICSSWDCAFSKKTSKSIKSVWSWEVRGQRLHGGTENIHAVL